jgi:hypothetical protein
MDFGQEANSIRKFTFHRIRSSGTRPLSQSCRWLEWRPALIQFAPSPTINSVRSIAGELRRPSPSVVAFQMEINFDSATAGRLAGGVRGVPP